MLSAAFINPSKDLLNLPSNLLNTIIREWTSVDFLSNLKPNFNYATLLKLRRSRFTVAGYKPKSTETLIKRLMSVMPFTGFSNQKPNSPDAEESRWANPFGNPLLYYIIQLNKIDHDYTKFFIKLFTAMSPYYHKCNPNFRQDFVRKTFSKLSSVIFNNIYNPDQSSKFTPLYGLEHLGGPSGYTTADIERMASSWVNAVPRRWGESKRGFVEERLKYYIGKWVDGRTTRSPLNFRSFCTDPYKWATSGGTYPVVLPDSTTKVRNKWGFGIASLFQGKNPYDVAVSNPNHNIASVALKEETKTRLIISTPMSSYLRQSYILYALGPMKHLSSTLFDKQIVTNFFNNITDYVALDASSFDQNIPKWFFTSFFSILKQSIMSMQGDLEHTAMLANEIIPILDDELSALDSLSIRYGNNIYPYHNGLLSGWRFTSLFGSLASAIVCDFINQEFGTNSPYIVQGDDIVMAYDPFFGTKENLLKAVADFGMEVNMRKSTFGPVGEFLKYRYHPTLIDALPARAVRSIFYMNPWLSNDPVDPIQTCLNSHLNLISRLSLCTQSSSFVPISIEGMEHDLSGLLNMPLSRIRSLIEVPIGAGGLGCYEMINFNKYVTPYFRTTGSGNQARQLYRAKNISIPVLNTVQKNPHLTTPMSTFLHKFNLLSYKNVNIYKTKNVSINNISINIDKTFGELHPEPAGVSDLNVESEPDSIDYFSVNRYATLLAVLVQKTVDGRFATALRACSGPFVMLTDSFTRLAECSFHSALRFFDKLEETISPPKSMYFDTRYHNSSQARSLTDFVRKSLHSCVTLPSLVFLNLLSASIYGSFSSFIHTL